MRSFLLSLFTLILAFVAMPETTYCTPSDVSLEYGDEYVAQKAGVASGEWYAERPDDPVTKTVQRHINASAAKINVAVRVQDPTLSYTSAHTYLNSLNIQGAHLFMLRARPGGLSEKKEIEYKRWVADIDAIAKGMHDLGKAPDGSPEAAPDDALDDGDTFRGPERLFGRKNAT